MISCSKKQNTEATVYYVIMPLKPDNQHLLDNPPPPPLPPFYGQLNFILLDTSIFFHNNYKQTDFSWCGTDQDFTKPPMLGLTPDSLIEIRINELQSFLTNSIPDSLDRSFFPCISSPTDTIKNKAFKIVTDYFKAKKIRSYNIRNWTEEEKFVVDAKINGKTYNADSIDWKIGFTTIPPPPDMIEEK